jgi:hypothetical protein
MLNFTPATAAAATAQTADAHAAQAATRPLAGFGAGAFLCEGTWAGSRTNEMAALALPRMKPAIRATGTSGAQAEAVGAASMTSTVETGTAKTGTAKTGTAKTGTAKTGGVVISTVGRIQADGIRLSKVHVDFVQADTDNFIQTARLYPVTPGGVGPNPAREPVPV